MLQQRSEEAELASQRKAILSMISHELRTPMNGILGSIQLLEQEYNQEYNQEYRQEYNQEYRQEYGESTTDSVAGIEPLETVKKSQLLQTVQRSAHALLEILNEVHDFAKLAAGKMILYPTCFDIRALFQEVTDAKQLQALQRD